MPVAKTTVKQQVYNLIFSDVLEGNFPLDEFITEKQLMERYQAGKAPVREALIELCSENILHSIPRLGYQIIQVTEKKHRGCNRVATESGTRCAEAGADPFHRRNAQPHFHVEPELVAGGAGRRNGSEEPLATQFVVPCHVSLFRRKRAGGGCGAKNDSAGMARVCADAVPAGTARQLFPAIHRQATSHD